MQVACFDIGGTGVKSALIGSDRVVTKKRTIPTPASLEDLLAFMVERLAVFGPVEAISLSVPGAIDYQTGVITGLSAIPYIHGFSWYDKLANFGLPVFLENDANCVGLSQLAVDENIQDMACVVCGTGIGGALIVHRKLVRGFQSYGGEFGYMMIEGVTHPVKNWSQLASTGSLVRAVQAQKPGDWTGQMIFEAAAAGDDICETAISTMVRNLAIGLMNLHYCIAPEKIYIGGGISQNADFLRRLCQQLADFVAEYVDFPVAPVVESCQYQQDANLVGAYMNAVQEMEGNK